MPPGGGEPPAASAAPSGGPCGPGLGEVLTADTPVSKIEIALWANGAKIGSAAAISSRTCFKASTRASRNPCGLGGAPGPGAVFL